MWRVAAITHGSRSNEPSDVVSDPATLTSEPVTRWIRLLARRTYLTSSADSVNDRLADPVSPVGTPSSGSYSSRAIETLPPMTSPAPEVLTASAPSWTKASRNRNVSSSNRSMNTRAVSPSLFVSSQVPLVDDQARTAEWGWLKKVSTSASPPPQSIGPKATGSFPGSVSVPVTEKAVPATLNRLLKLPSRKLSVKLNVSAASRLATMCASPDGRRGIVTSALVEVNDALTGRS